jgi:NAD(P)-dependent dehydrogenase (short-subunit alcohol dehydrogenase family)
MKAYAQSKLLMNIFTFEMARRMDGTGVSVNCVHPGAVRTGLGSESANNPVLKFVDRIVKMFFISSHKAAKAPFMLATSAQMEGVSGKYFQKDKDVPASRQSYDPVLAKKVWEISTKMTGL